MSSKSKESPASSSQASSSASQSRSNSPLSQAFRRRKEEKVELQNLTYRLANYIDAVRQLVSENNRLNLQITTTQDENNRLNLQITTTQDTFSREMTSVIGKYEKELSATRQLLDETAKEKARLKLDAGQSREMTSVIGKYEKELSDTRQLLDETAEEKGKLQLDAGRSRAELGELTQKFNKAKNDLQVEKQVQVLLQSTLQELRDQYKSQIQVIQQSRDEVEILHHNKVEDLEDQIEKLRNSASSHYEELISARNRLKDATLKLSGLELANSHMKDRFGQLERNFETERQAHATAMQDASAFYQGEISRLQERMDVQSQAYQHLMDIRTRLLNCYVIY